MTASQTILYSAQKFSTIIDPNSRAIRLKRVIEALDSYRELWSAAFSEPMMFDDAYLTHMNYEQLLHYWATQCEVLISKTTEGEVIGFSIYREVFPNRSANLDTYCVPSFRTGLANQKLVKAIALDDVIGYGWSIGFRKIKCNVAVENISAVKFVTRLGFRVVGLSHNDGLFGGVWRDMMSLELLNPDYFCEIGEIISVKERASAEPIQQHVDDAASVAVTDGVSTGERAGAKRRAADARWNKGRAEAGQDTAGVVYIGPEPTLLI